MTTSQGKKILIVEDNPGDQLLITELLRLSILNIREVLYASTVQTAVEMTGQTAPDVILLDLSLPDSSGLDTFLTVQSINEKIPIVILSGLSDKEIALQAIQNGAQDYLVKDDCNEHTLAKTIRYSIERKRNLEELRISNERYHLISSATNDMIWDWNLQTGDVYRNGDQFTRILKLPVALKDKSGDFWFSRIHPDDIGLIQRIMEQIQNDPEKKNFESEYRFLNGENEYIYLYDRGYVVRNQKEIAVRIIGSTQDITVRKKAEKELQKLSLIAKETTNAVIITDPTGLIEWVNEAFTKVTEYSLEDVRGKKPGDILQGANTDPDTVRYLREKIQQNSNFGCEIQNYSKSGRPYWVEIQGQPMLDEKGGLLHFFAIQTDITERKAAEDKLRQSEEKYRYLYNSIPASIIIWKLDDFCILDVNDTAISHYGYNRVEFLSKTILDLRLPEDYPLITEFANEAKKTDNYSSSKVWRHVKKNGQIVFMEINSQRILYKGQTAMMASCIDVTEKRLLEERLREERELKEKEITQAVILAQDREREEIGRELHDNVNQILAIARLYLQMAARKEKLSHNYVHDSSDLIHNAIGEIRNLSHALIPPAFDINSFKEAIDSIIEIFKVGNNLIIQKNISEIEDHSIDDKLFLCMYRILQEQFNNIIKYANARKVIISIYRKNDSVCLSIKDDGQGFDSTKKSSGIGLLNIKTRASLFNGTMALHTAPGKGCELVVTFKNH